MASKSNCTLAIFFAIIISKIITNILDNHAKFTKVSQQNMKFQVTFKCEAELYPHWAHMLVNEDKKSMDYTWSASHEGLRQ